MKQCMICGNQSDDDSTVCEMCGTPFGNMENSTESGDGEVQTENKQEVVEQTENMDVESSQQADQTQAEPVPQSSHIASGKTAPQPVRRMRSGPRIYGQQEGIPAGAPGSANGQRVPNMSGMANGRTVNGSGMANGRPMNGPGMANGRPMNGPGMANGRPMNGPGMANGRPMNGSGMPNGRPMNAPGMVNERAMSGAAMPTYYSGKIMETARGILRSPIMLLIALLHTVYLISSIAAIFLKELNFSQVMRVVTDVNLPTQITGYMDNLIKLAAKLDTGAILTNLVIRIPDLLFCIGLWLVYAAVHTKKENMPTIGFTFMKAVVIIEFVKMSLLMLLGLVISVALVVSAWAAGTQSMIIAAAITIVLMIVITMMVVMYYFCYLATIKTWKLNTSVGESYGNVSAYVAVVHILFALFGIINLLSGIVNMEISGIVGSAAKMGWMILLAILIFSYRSAMSEEE